MTNHEHAAGAAKYNTLITHLKKHNDEHIADLQKWMREIETEGFADAASELKKAIELSREIDTCFKAALKKLEIKCC